MDEEIERLVVSVRADTQAFSRDVQEMKSVLEGPFGAGVERAGKLLESSLTRALRSGKLGFEELKQVALSVSAEIAAASIRSGLGALGQGGGSGGGGLLSLAASVLGAFSGAPGRATGGPVSPGRAYLVGERGPEVFVPTGSGSVATMGPPASRDIRVSIAINAPAASAPDMLARSSRQVARAVRLSLAREE